MMASWRCELYYRRFGDPYCFYIQEDLRNTIYILSHVKIPKFRNLLHTFKATWACSRNGTHP